MLPQSPQLPEQKHLNLYIHLWELKRIFSEMNQYKTKTLEGYRLPEKVLYMLCEAFELASGVFPSLDDMDELMSNKYWQPKTKYMVHGLLNRGYSQVQIANLLQIAQPSVSYHAKHPLVNEYVNPGIRAILGKRIHQL